MRGNSFFLAAALFLTLQASGCGEKPPVPAPAPSANKVTPAPQKSAAVQAAAPEDPPQKKYTYEPAGRRDPFVPLLMIQKAANQADEPLTPLQTFELGQLRLMAVIIGKGTPTAMVLAPDGKGYILKKGIKVGKNNGRVVGINQDRVLVEEEYSDLIGELKKSVQEILLPKREGV